MSFESGLACFDSKTNPDKPVSKFKKYSGACSAAPASGHVRSSPTSSRSAPASSNSCVCVSKWTQPEQPRSLSKVCCIAFFTLRRFSCALGPKFVEPQPSLNFHYLAQLAPSSEFKPFHKLSFYSQIANRSHVSLCLQAS